MDRLEILKLQKKFKNKILTLRQRQLGILKKFEKKITDKKINESLEKIKKL